jgi:hypothetical protein
MHVSLSSKKEPVNVNVVHWGDVHMVGKRGRPMIHEHLACGHAFDPVVTCSACGDRVEPRAVRIRPAPGAARGMLRE